MGPDDYRSDEERLMDCFRNGLAMGTAFALVSVLAILVMILLMFRF